MAHRVMYMMYTCRRICLLLSLCAASDITIDKSPEKGTEDDPLGPGSRLTCRVGGGTPLLDHTNFTCDSPYYRGTTVKAGPGLVISSITMTNLLDDDGVMTCTCSAAWSPRPDTNRHTTAALFHIKFQPSILYFFINDTVDKATVDNQHGIVTLVCKARGRPTPNITFYNNANVVIARKAADSLSPLITETADVMVTDCCQTGRYTCEASNTLHNGTRTSAVFLNITCPPAPDDDTFNGDIPKISKSNPLTFSLKANPPPHHFHFVYADRGLTNESFIPLSYEFQASCRHERDRPYLARCSVEAVSVPSNYLGIYNATAVSTLGNFSFQFEVISYKEVSDSTGTAATTGLAIKVLLPTLALVVIAAMLIYKYRHRPIAKCNTDPRHETNIGTWHELRQSCSNGFSVLRALVSRACGGSREPDYDDVPPRPVSNLYIPTHEPLAATLSMESCGNGYASAKDFSKDSYTIAKSEVMSQEPNLKTATEDTAEDGMPNRNKDLQFINKPVKPDRKKRKVSKGVEPSESGDINLRTAAAVNAQHTEDMNAGDSPREEYDVISHTAASKKALPQHDNVYDNIGNVAKVHS